MRTIRASEINTFIYCQRAWWYQNNGQQSENAADMAAGSRLHYQHGNAAMHIGCLRIAAYTLILLALLLIVIYLTIQFI